MDQKRVVNSGWIFLGLCALIVYLYLGVTLTHSVFFGFDMPRVALIAKDFLARGSFLTSQEYFHESAWLNIPWGPALIYFYSFLILISFHPPVISQMLLVLNIIGLLSVVAIGWKFFNPKVGILSGLLLASNPYWLVYLRLIYQPSPITLFLPISMLLLLTTLKLKKGIAVVLLPISWAVLIQVYLPTYAFIATSVIALLFIIKSVSKKELLLGVFISALLFIPTGKFLYENPIYVNRYLEAPSRFTPPEKTITERISGVTASFFQIPVGGKFDWQTGYAYKDFVKNYVPEMPTIGKVLSGLFLASLIWNLFMAIKRRDLTRGTLVFWALCPLWSLVLLWVTDLVPRYFLITIPAGMLLIALFLSDMGELLRKLSLLKFVPVILGLLIAVYWFSVSYRYNTFVNEYSYPSGWFRDVSETPYLYIDNAVVWVISDAKTRNCEGVVLSNDENDPNYNLWMETRYVWENVYKMGYVDNKSDFACHYLLVHGHVSKKLGITDAKKFGPFSAFFYY